MRVDEEKKKFLVEVNGFVKTLDENVREAAFNFLVGEFNVSSELTPAPRSAARTEGGASGDDRGISPQELIRQTNAKSNMAKAEVLGYWLEVHQSKQSFSSGDLKDAFSVAREPAPGNPSDVVAKLASAGKLMLAEKIGVVQHFRLTRTAIDEVRSWLNQ
ncbi:MAG: hypothetical protein QOH01_1801 [Verrucomicrobiota bacterium]|jgi:hypothetical protein